jgi:hypothetical protein
VLPFGRLWPDFQCCPASQDRARTILALRHDG